MRRATRWSLVAWLYCSAVGAGASTTGCVPDLPPDGVTGTASAAICGDGYVDLAAGEQCDPGANAGWGAGNVCNAKCQVECGDGGFVWPVNNHCYQVMSNASDLDPGAVSQCNNGGHVVTFGSEAEFGAVAWANDVGPFWVGLTTAASRPYVSEESFEPGWSATCPGCYAYTPDPTVPLRPWVGAWGDAGEDAAASYEQCVAAYSSPGTYWCQYPCYGLPSTRVVCEREPIGEQYTQCDAGVCVNLVVTQGRKHYLYIDTPTAPEEAEAQCTLGGGMLVVFESPEEREQLWKQLRMLTEPPARFWIGLHQMLNQTTGMAEWVWDDGISAEGSTAHPSEWGDNEPSEPGATSRAYVRHIPQGIDDTLARNDEAEDLLPFVCQFPGPGVDTPSALAP